ncbi:MULTISPECIES: DUF3040 domain-containing protein [Pseudonocardia]|uniref:DUF3040 domain-containing protein n=1 Tax=Pseudonocardia abyssalis TaxID=2792008 RepID=A0ABS6V0E1_9PSEU|nr:DUF3040 domain-containing protein [Pseudonocardia abyssalis]MBW0115137.1 DUF3040 domain-containing protein [Pseudonocardia abyssalis]MBW0137976.1 DUF3040 domain-containing protein [Pseudonocardia abyssalis]
MTLDRRQRRALRDIERALSVDDPVLAAALSEGPGRLLVVGRWVTRSLAWGGALMLLAGVVLPDGGFVAGGMVALLLCWIPARYAADPGGAQPR